MLLPIYRCDVPHPDTADRIHDGKFGASLGDHLLRRPLNYF
jgi:hypothetical protein